MIVQSPDGPDLQVRRASETSFEVVDAPGDRQPLHIAVVHVVEAHDSDEQPEISGKHALRSTEIIFGVWESPYRRGRLEFPLNIENNPLEAGNLSPTRLK